jgi:hypothetical protein
MVIGALALGSPARSQEPAPSTESLAEAARNAREQKLNSTKDQKIFTNDDFSRPASSPNELTTAPEPSAKKPSQVAKPQSGDCDNPEAARIQEDLEAAQEQLERVQQDLSYDPKVISDGDVDMTNFKSGSSGLAFGSPPLLQSQPQAPARVDEVMLTEKVASLKDALRIACDSPEDAGIQKKLDTLQQQLNVLQRQFALDQAAFYSKPNYAQDDAGKAALEAEEQQIQSLQSEIAQLKDELAASKETPTAP